MPQKNAFHDSATFVLKCWGYVESNAPGDIKVPVDDNFFLQPGDYRWDGVQYVPYTKPTSITTEADQARATLKSLNPKNATTEQILTLLQQIL